MGAEASVVRVGAALDPGLIPRWQRTLLEGLEFLPGCALTAWAQTPGADRPGPRPPPLFCLYERWDRARFRESADALALVDPPSIVGTGAPGEPVDLVLWLTERPLPERSPEGVRHGVWFIRQGAARVDRDAPLFAELQAGEGAAVTSLCTLVGDREHVLARSTGPSDRVSLHRSRARAYARAALLPLRGFGRIQAAATLGGGVSPMHPKPPSVVATVDMLTRLGARLLRRKLRALLVEPRWVLAYRRTEERDQGLALTGSFRTLLPPQGRAFADPFPMDHPSGDAMLFEDYEPGSERGKIVAVSLDSARGAGTPELVLSRDTHLSYPFLLRDEGHVFMVPESRQAREVELLRSTDFPLGWHHERVLINGLSATDSTLFRHGGKIWLFAALSPDGDAAVDELHLFSAPALDGRWTPHPANPVVSDVRSARPAGALFHHGDQLLRPAQDCSRAYGWRVVLNRVEILNGSEYRETPVGRIEPVGRSVTRVHTYNASGRWEALDALWLTPRFIRRGGPSSLRFRLVRYPSWHY